LQTLKRGKLALIEFDLPQENCPIVDKLVKDIKLPPDCVLVAIIRGDEVLIPRGDTLIKTGDSVIALASREKERLLKKSLLGR
jgi:trk system potassium uptake protein TrkA